MDPAAFIKIFQGVGPQPASFMIGTIPASYTTGRPTLTFDGESTATVRTYPYLSSYTPAANDRVLIAIVGHSGVVIGKIV
ncbi:MAG: hypothetical protein ACQEXQ_16285 [Bacillota bacterium]